MVSFSTYLRIVYTQLKQNKQDGDKKKPKTSSKLLKILGIIIQLLSFAISIPVEVRITQIFFNKPDDSEISPQEPSPPIKNDLLPQAPKRIVADAPPENQQPHPQGTEYVALPEEPHTNKTVPPNMDSLSLYQEIFASSDPFDQGSLTEYEKLANSLYYESFYRESARLNALILKHPISEKRQNIALANLKLASDCWKRNSNTRDDFLNELNNLSVIGIVNYPNVKLRRNPAISGNILREMDILEEVLVIAQVDGEIPNKSEEYQNSPLWYYIVDSSGKEGYVYGFYLGLYPMDS
jgi:hypothetical protein